MIEFGRRSLSVSSKGGAVANHAPTLLCPYPTERHDTSHLGRCLRKHAATTRGELLELRLQAKSSSSYRRLPMSACLSGLAIH